MNTDLAYCQPFPTKIAIIDDDSDYLEQVTLLIDDHVECDLFTSPTQALKKIHSVDKESVSFITKDSHQRHNMVDDRKRSDHFSVMVIDYAMPEMNGLDFCKQIRNPYIKKILITGKANTEVAIEAFNQGIIDQFIRKEEDDIEIRLNTAINRLSHQYFTEINTAKVAKVAKTAKTAKNEIPSQHILNRSNHKTELDILKIRLLANVQLFSELKAKELSVIMQSAKLTFVPKNTIILFQKDTSNSMFFIISGRVKVYLTNDKNQEMILNYQEAGEFFGELALLDEQPRSASVMSTTKCELLILSGDSLMHIFNRYPQINLKIMRAMAKRVRELTSKVESLALLDIYDRVADVLIKLATNNDGMLVVESKPTQKEIALMIGSSREMVTRVMGEMLSQGFIHKDGDSIIIDQSFPQIKQFSS